MQKLLFTGALACTIALAAHPASDAGERLRKLVTIEEFNGVKFATGHAGDVFNSQGSVETIWCRARAYRDDYISGMCFARDEKGRTLQCGADEKEIVRMMGRINGDSSIQFNLTDTGRCNAVIVTNGSYAAPKRQTTEDTLPPIDVTGQLDELE